MPVQPKWERRGQLVLVRHGESQFNASNTWTGITDVDLTPKGHQDAARMGQLLADLRFDRVYTSCLRRAVQTRDDLLGAHGSTPSSLYKTAALNERDYGELTGLDKAAVAHRVGESAYKDIRRGFDAVIPNGESLRDVYERVVPWYLANVVPRLMAWQTVLIVGHGNSDRALRKYVERVSDAAVANLEMDFDKVYIYDIEPDGHCHGTPQVRTLGSVDET